MSASIRRPCGKLPGPGGFLRKSPMSLPAQNASPAPRQSTTRIASSLSASLRMSARLVYMLDVIAFLWAGRLSWTRRIAPEGSVMMSLIGCSLFAAFRLLLVTHHLFLKPLPAFRDDALGRAFLGFRHGAARAQVLDALRVKSQVTEDLFGVLTEVGPTPRRHLGDAVHLN